MERYVESHNFNAEASFDTSQFQDVELLGTIIQFRNMNANFWENIGPGGSITSRPMVHEDTVYFGSCDKNFYALTLEGMEKWRFQTKGMVAEGGDIGNGKIYFGSADRNLYCLTLDGKLVWKFETNDKIMEKPVFHNGQVLVGSNDHNLYNLDAETGKLLWKFRMKSEGAACPLVMNDRIYFGYKDNVFYCLSLEGKLIWKFETQGIIAAWPAATHNNKLYFGSWDQNLYCISLDGKLIWKFKANAAVMAPYCYNGKLYFGCWDNSIYCVDAETGRLVWKFETKNMAGGYFQVKGGVAYAPSYDNNIYALDAETGKMLWKHKTQGIIMQATSFGDKVFAGSWDCKLYCLSLEGKLLWRFNSSISSPSSVIPPETSIARTMEVVVQTESEEQEDRYKVTELAPQESESKYIKKSDYIKESTYTVKKFRTISDQEF